MSRRKNRANDSKPATPYQVERAIREAAGRDGYASAGKTPARRLRCSRCNKTWKFSDKLNFSPCPKCKEGRLS